MASQTMETIKRPLAMLMLIIIINNRQTRTINRIHTQQPELWEMLLINMRINIYRPLRKLKAFNQHILITIQFI